MSVCEDDAFGASLGVGGFEPPLEKPKWPLVPIIFDDPQRSAPGVIEYVVALMNVPKHEFQFPTSCPPYEERIVQHHHVVAAQRLVLNCEVVGVVPGGTAVIFAMRADVPARVRGRATIVWVLDPPFGSSTREEIVL